MNRRNITTAIMAVGAVVLLYTGVAMAREPERAPVAGNGVPRAAQVVDDRGDHIQEATSSLDDRGNDVRETEPGDDRGNDAAAPTMSPSFDDHGNDAAEAAPIASFDDRGADRARPAMSPSASTAPSSPADDTAHDSSGHH